MKGPGAFPRRRLTALLHPPTCPPTRWAVGPAEAGERYNLAVSDKANVSRCRDFFTAVKCRTQIRKAPRSNARSFERRRAGGLGVSPSKAWTPCRFGGERPWFACSAESNGVDCGRRVTKLYSVGGLFACRHCHRLAYESQQESTRHRGLGKARKIRMQLGGSANMFKEFPDKPKHMHWRTYNRLRRAHNIAEYRTMNGLMRFFRLDSAI
jgi:ribosomal protein L37E